MERTSVLGVGCAAGRKAWGWVPAGRLTLVDGDFLGPRCSPEEAILGDPKDSRAKPPLARPLLPEPLPLVRRGQGAGGRRPNAISR